MYVKNNKMKHTRTYCLRLLGFLYFDDIWVISLFIRLHSLYKMLKLGLHSTVSNIVIKFYGNYQHYWALTYTGLTISSARTFYDFNALLSVGNIWFGLTCKNMDFRRVLPMDLRMRSFGAVETIYIFNYWTLD